MLFNYIKIAYRNLGKHRLYTLVTIIGLGVGFAASLLLFRMVQYELSFNTHFANYDRIVRVIHQGFNVHGESDYSVCTPIPVMDVMEEEVSQFEAMSRVKELWTTLSLPDPNGGVPLQKYGQGDDEIGFFIETPFFDIFDVQWLVGNATEAVEVPNTIVLTETWAKKFFDRPADAINQTLLMNNLIPVTITGVITDFPQNCDFNAPYLVSWKTLKAHSDYFYFDETNWGSCSSNNQVYALLNSPDQFDAANAVLAKVGAEEYTDEAIGQTRIHMLQKLSDLHYDDRVHNSGTHRTSRSRLRILVAVGILILIMACFNFINLATAQSTLRAREVGVRKTLGSTRSQLIIQFLTETGLIVGVSLFLGVVLAILGLPILHQLSDVPAELPFLSQPSVWLFILLVSVAVTFLAGSYPALVLAGFRPIEALKNQVSRSRTGGIALRKSLVVLQFAIAQVLIVSTIITLLQLDYIRERELGFNDDLIYTFGVGVDSTATARRAALKNRLLQLPGIEAISFSSDQPLSGNTWAQSFRYGSRPEDERYSVTLKFCDAQYRETYGLELLAGDWYPESDTSRYGVINHALLKKLGITDPQEVIGQNLFLGSSPTKITGVVTDFHTHSLHEAHQPLILTTNSEFYWETGVKMRPGDVNETITAIEKTFNEVIPEEIFNGRFLDDRIAEFYADDTRLADTARGFGLLAIIISCLGLFGLAAHAAQGRLKEVGVRKVLGASVSQIVGLLSKDFIQLVGVALLVASPIAYWLMQQWLADFVYRIDIQWWVFVLAGILALTVAFLTVGYQALRAALVSPTRSLRSE